MVGSDVHVYGECMECTHSKKYWGGLVMRGSGWCSPALCHCMCLPVFMFATLQEVASLIAKEQQTLASESARKLCTLRVLP